MGTDDCWLFLPWLSDALQNPEVHAARQALTWGRTTTDTPQLGAPLRAAHGIIHPGAPGQIFLSWEIERTRF